MNTTKVIVIDSNRQDKRYRAVLFDNNGNNIGKVDFGSSKHDNYTIHNEKKRKYAYIQRHSRNENWTKSGITTAGFWSRWLLWNTKSLKSAAKDIKKRFGVVVELNV